MGWKEGEDNSSGKMSNQLDIFEEYNRLEKELVQERKLRIEWQRKYYELEKRVNELEKKLSQFLNSNTPSSAIPIFLKPKITSPNRPPTGTNPKGKPEGGNGATKELPTKIDRKVEATSNQCPKGHSNIRKIGTYSKIFYEIAKIRLDVVEACVGQYVCNVDGCHTVFEGTNPEVPKEGMIGPNLQAFVSELKHGFAGSYEKISGFLDDLTGTTFSPQGLNDCVHRVSDQLKPSYLQMERELRNSNAVSSDETGWSVNGEKWWLWLLTTANMIFLTVNKSRGRKVITRILGNNFEGTITSDCLNVYQEFAEAFQRCWAHLLRRTHSFAEKYPRRDIKKLHEQLSSFYNEVSEFLDKDPPYEQRVWHCIMYHQKLKAITKHKWYSKEAKQIVNNFLKKFDGQWLVAVIMHDVELTNNKTERGIRKVIPTRKLLGGHRTEGGANDFAIIETHRQTWKLRGKSPYLEMVDYLKQRNIAA